MSQRYIGSSISPTAAPTSSTSTTGVWSINDQYQAKNANNWPVYTPPASTDPYFLYVSMLLPGNGTNGAQNNTFLDSSTNNFTITRNGNTTQGTASPYYSCWSNYFDGTGDYLTVPTNASLGMGTGDFTIELWAFFGNTTGRPEEGLIDTRTTSTGTNQWLLYKTYGANTLEWYTGGSTRITGTIPSANQWVHVAVVRSSGVTKMYINGTQSGSSYTDTNNYASSGATYIGCWYTTAQPLFGYISNVRMVKGTAVYTTTFTPPTTPLTAITNTSLLTCQSNRFIDNSPNNFTVTKNGDTSVQKFSPFEPVTVTPASYSAYFDGTGDYLTVPDNAAFDFTGDFTMEAWVYPMGYGADNAIACQWTAGLSFIWKVVSGNRLYFAGYPGGTVVFQGSSTTVDLNKWSHVAITRSGTTARLFVNGVLDATTATISGTLAGTDPITIGSLGTSQYWNGDISNLRIVKGTALYTSTFTPPTAPLTAVSGTSLLTCQSSTFIDNSGNALAVTVYGNSQPIIASPFTSTTSAITPYAAATNGGSAYFDGSGDYLSVTNNTAFSFGTGSFTIEAWVNTTYISAQQTIVGTTTGSNGWTLDTTTTGVALIGFGGANITGTRKVCDGAWHHIAAVRNGASALSLYVDGVLDGTATNSANVTVTAAVRVGSYYASFPQYFTGYIADVRINKGSAVYTSAFIPPAAPVIAITNTQFLVNATNGGVIDNASINVLETVGNAQISTAQSKFGGSSVYFDGAGDYLQIPTNQVFAYRTGDFTIELWVYITSLAGNRQFYESYAGDSAGRLLMFVSTGGAVTVQGSAGSSKTSGGSISINTWTHIAVTKASGSMRIFVNGTQVNTTYTDSSTYTCTEPVKIGINGYDNSSYPFLGYMDDYRITNGYARYTANFTAPTVAFPTS
jgi:hypothetical protein